MKHPNQEYPLSTVDILDCHTTGLAEKVGFHMKSHFIAGWIDGLLTKRVLYYIYIILTRLTLLMLPPKADKVRCKSLRPQSISLKHDLFLDMLCQVPPVGLAMLPALSEALTGGRSAHLTDKRVQPLVGSWTLLAVSWPLLPIPSDCSSLTGTQRQKPLVHAALYATLR